MKRIALAGLAVVVGSILVATPANAGVNDVKPLAKKFSAAGYKCTVKPAVANYREANCYKDGAYVHMVAFSSSAALKQWFTLWCDMGTGEPFISDRKTWMVDSTDVPLKDLQEIAGGRVTDVC
jgi:hypothetical protein